MKKIFVAAPGSPLATLLCGTPTVKDCTFDAVIPALEQYDGKPYSFSPWLHNSSAVRFVCESLHGLKRHSAMEIPYLQHVFASTYIGIAKNLPEHLIWSLFLKAAAQQYMTNTDLGAEDLAVVVKGINNDKLQKVLDQLATLHDFLNPAGRKARRNASKKSKNDAKLAYLESIDTEALLVELICKYEHLIADAKDLSEAGNIHWRAFHSKTGELLNYYEKCLEIFRPLATVYSFVEEILNDYAERLAELRILNKKPAKKVVAEEA